MLMTASASVAYFADGLVMASIRSKALAGRVCKYVFRFSSVSLEGLSLIQISTLDTPRKVMLPSTSTSTPGAFCKASSVVPVWMEASSLTL